MRLALTIILNGLHHLKHNDYYLRVLDMCDIWAISEGACESTGSTAWCNPMSPEYHNNGRSIDGTSEFLLELTAKHNNIAVIQSTGMWKNKDLMVNAAVSILPHDEGKHFLWEIDADEQWLASSMTNAEQQLEYMGGDCGEFYCNYEVGNRYRAIGNWGEGKILPYRRLWKWRGQSFSTHEPPELVGGNGHTILLPQRFTHYAYYFDSDVKFKDKWYGGHQGIYNNWKSLQKSEALNLPAEALLPDGMKAYHHGTSLIKYSA